MALILLYALINFALATYLAGVSTGWLFRLLGIFLACSLVITAYLEHYVWILIGLPLTVLLLYHFLLNSFGNGDQ